MSEQFVVLNGTKTARLVTSDFGDGIITSEDYAGRKAHSRDNEVRPASEEEVSDYFTRREALLLSKRDKMRTELMAIERELARLAEMSAGESETVEE